MKRPTSNPPAFDLFTNVNYLLRRAHQRAEGIFADAMTDLDITPRQATLLYVIKENPGTTLTEITHLGGMDRGTISEMVPRMVARGLITESRHPEDGRAKALTITDTGAGLIDTVVARTPDVAEAVLDSLPPEYRLLFVRMLSLMTGVEAESQTAL